MKFIFVLRSDGTVKYYNATSTTMFEVPELLNSKTLYLFNPDEKDNQALESRAFTVIATSPDVKHYSNFIKHMNMRKLILPPWTKDELIAAHRALQPLGVLTAEQRALVEQRYDEVGGSLRFSLYDAPTYTVQVLDMIASVADEIPVSVLKLWVDTVKNEKSGSKLKLLPHLLFHIFPSKDKVPGKMCLTFASRKSEEVIFNRISIKSHVEWRKFVDIMRHIDPTRTGLGLKYELYIHAYMCNYLKMPKLTVFRRTNDATWMDAKYVIDTVLKQAPVYMRSAPPLVDVAIAVSSGVCTYVAPQTQLYSIIRSLILSTSWIRLSTAFK